MLKLSNRSSTVLYPARKITEFFQPVTSLPLRASSQAESSREERASRDASSYDQVARSASTSTKVKSSKRSEKGMPSNASTQEILSSSRKRTRDGRLVDRTRAPDVSDAAKMAPVTNGSIRPQHRTLLPAVPISEKGSDDGKKDSEEKRSLRSKAGGTRLRSDLATYFPNFEDVVAGVAHPPEFLTIDEPIQITESGQQTSRSPPAVRRRSVIKLPTLRPQFEKIDLFALADNAVEEEVIDDPLNDDVFLPSHRRAERREKQLRNIEKERAQHEKGQLESLLESLQGPDWLRVMGVTGITDGARKDYEPRRDYFVREVKALLRKFRIWKDAEKKLMLEKAARDEEEDDDEEEDLAASVEEDDMTETEDNDLSTDDPDAWAARQLRLEARSAQTKSVRSYQKPKLREKAPPKPPKPPEPPKPFTSFFEKPHVRQAALSKGRHSARRVVLAFGLPIPDMEEQEFDLPKNFMSRDAMLAYARKRRRRNREKKEAEAEADEKAHGSKIL